ncbi:hypothetical protein CLU79DRAFT_781403 [Phycomyces nitens]|nr:hypothetical protein CLU79DRAFT_781403 [Phycomyces nitens]
MILYNGQFECLLSFFKKKYSLSVKASRLLEVSVNRHCEESHCYALINCGVYFGCLIVQPINLEVIKDLPIQIYKYLYWLSILLYSLCITIYMFEPLSK